MKFSDVSFSDTDSPRDPPLGAMNDEEEDAKLIATDAI
jgi:hypothetical protein